MQALTLWEIGLRKWLEKRTGRATPSKRAGVAINRRDLFAIPIPGANLLWRDLHVREVRKEDGRQQTRNIRVQVTVEGVADTKLWVCGLEFDYANEESLYCRPQRTASELAEIPPEAKNIRVSYLPPMSGLADREFLKAPGEVGFLIGQGRTSQVLRNLCYQLYADESTRPRWERVKERMAELFGIALGDPELIEERSEILMGYRDAGTVRLDLSSIGRGAQQTLLLLTYLSLNPKTVLLLDEPDAHLEILRQRQIYDILTKAAAESHGQIIAVSHSEVILNEAADRDIVIAFVGQPHRIDDRGSQVAKSLKEIGFEQYYQAEQVGWVLYLEGSTDLSILKTLAEVLMHPVEESLNRPFVRYVENQPSRARDHFYGLREAKRDLVGMALFDRIDLRPQDQTYLREYSWSRRELENYLLCTEALLAWAERSDETESPGPLFDAAVRERRREIMQQCIEDLVPPIALRDRNDRWWREVKASDDFFDRLFQAFYEKLGLPNLMRKTDYHVLARFMPAEQIEQEVKSVLDMILDVAKRAVVA